MEQLSGLIENAEFPTFAKWLGLGAAGSCVAMWMAGQSQFQIKRHQVKRVREQFQMKCKEDLKKLEAQLSNKGNSSIQTKFEAIRQLSMEDLYEKIQTQVIKPEDVLKAYQSQALIAQEKCNCIVHPFDEAVELAKALPESEKKKGILHGIPISLKDDVLVKGYTSALGISTLLDEIAEEDSVIAKVLKAEGAIPFVKTTVPQMCCSIECSNPITGTTTNPHDPTRTCGGSSGGEGALIASGGSILGIGSDIGGSIRIPAHFCGIVGFKPSCQRISPKGLAGNNEVGQIIVWTSWGPISRDVDGVVRCMQALTTDVMYDLDPKIPPLHFNYEMYNATKSLRIGFTVQGGTVESTPACSRAVHEAKAALECLGHKVEAWDVPLAEPLFKAYAKSIAADGGIVVSEHLSGDDMDPCVEPIIDNISLPGMWNTLKRAIYKLVDPKKAQKLGDMTGIPSINTYYKHIAYVEHLKQQFFEAWDAAGLDVLICPPCPVVATKLGSAKFLFECISHTELYNILDMPAGVVPVTKVTQDDVTQLLQSYSSHDKALMKQIVEDQCDSVGLPVGVQVIAPRWKDELCLRVMKELETSISKH